MRWQFNESLLFFFISSRSTHWQRCVIVQLLGSSASISPHIYWLSIKTIPFTSNGWCAEHRLEPKCWCSIYDTSIDSSHGFNWLIYFHRAANTLKTAFNRFDRNVNKKDHKSHHEHQTLRVMCNVFAVQMGGNNFYMNFIILLKWHWLDLCASLQLALEQ